MELPGRAGEAIVLLFHEAFRPDLKTLPTGRGRSPSAAMVARVNDWPTDTRERTPSGVMSRLVLPYGHGLAPRPDGLS